MNLQIPQSWPGSAEVRQFLARLRNAPYAVLMLDYDGTLAPFQEDRLNTEFYPGVRERLERLLSLDKLMVVLISGRKAQELRTLARLSRPIEIWGSHGREHLFCDGRIEVAALTEFEEAALKQAVAHLERKYDRETLECKVNSAAIHWRSAPERRNEIEKSMTALYHELAADQGKRVGRQPEGTIRLLPFDGGMELRMGLVTKGDAVAKILLESKDSTVSAFLGDDITDEDAFQALGDRRSEGNRLGVLVRSAPRPSYADLWLSPPRELLLFLDAWIEARETA